MTFGLGVELEVIEEAVLPQEVQHCRRVEVILSSRVPSAWAQCKTDLCTCKKEKRREEKEGKGEEIPWNPVVCL